MNRGFKSRCEEMARSLRLELGLRVTDQLSVQSVAEYLDVSLWNLSDLKLSDEDFLQLTQVDGDSWSAFSVSAFGKDAIVIHPFRSKARKSSDVMHELAHLLLGHEPSTIFFVGDSDLALRGFNQTTEDEATWLSGTLLLPRNALVYVKRQGISQESACSKYAVSVEMLKYRLGVTGVNRQFTYSKI